MVDLFLKDLKVRSLALSRNLNTQLLASVFLLSELIGYSIILGFHFR